MADVLIGLILLIAGAELLVRGASRLAETAGVPRLVIGLTVVAYGTSTPELGVSTIASLHGQADIAIGNVVGSNILNVLLILGVSALIRPLRVSAQLVRLDVPVMIGASLAVAGVALDGRLDRFESMLLLLGALTYTLVLIRLGRREVAAGQIAGAPAKPALSAQRAAWDIGLVIAGLVLLVAGAEQLVDGAVRLARWLGVSELTIGLTIVAAGTSVPELATSIVAAIRHERDIAVGNIIGSNVFNIFTILGIAGIVSSDGIHVSAAAASFDIPVMIAVAVACLPIFFTGSEISRAEGLLFVVYYIAYVAYVLLEAAEHAALPAFSNMMTLFVMPLTLLGLIFSLARSRNRNRKPDSPGP